MEDPHFSLLQLGILQPISIKFETDDYTGDATPHAKFRFYIFSGGVSPYRLSYRPPVSIFYLSFFSFFLLLPITVTLLMLKNGKNQCKQTSQFKTQYKGDISHASQTAKFTV